MGYMRQFLFPLLVSLSVMSSTSMASVETEAETAPEAQKITSRLPLVESSLSYSLRYALPNDYSVISSLTMKSLPRGSLRVSYAGPYALIANQVKRQFRNLLSEQSSREDPYLSNPEIQLRQHRRDNLWHYEDGGDNWWERNWWESMIPAKGGAPLGTYTHVIGSEERFKFGPVTMTNTFQFSLERLGFIQFNSDTDSKIDVLRQSNGQAQSNRRQPKLHVALDVRPSNQFGGGTTILFNLKPKLQLGIPDSGTILSALRSASLRAEFEVIYHGELVARSEISVRYDPSQGAAITIDLAFLSW